MIRTSIFEIGNSPSYCWDKTTVYIIMVGQLVSEYRPAIQQHAILDLVIGWDGSTMEECHWGSGMGWWVVQHDVMIWTSCVVNLCDLPYRSISILLFSLNITASQHLELIHVTYTCPFYITLIINLYILFHSKILWLCIVHRLRMVVFGWLFSNPLEFKGNSTLLQVAGSTASLT